MAVIYTIMSLGFWIAAWIVAGDTIPWWARLLAISIWFFLLAIIRAVWDVEKRVNR